MSLYDFWGQRHPKLPFWKKMNTFEGFRIEPMCETGISKSVSPTCFTKSGTRCVTCIYCHFQRWFDSRQDHSLKDFLILIRKDDTRYNPER